MFLGRLAELLVAEWLDSQGWAITGLEALGAASDIEAIAPNEHASTSFEVKFIGVDDTSFDMLVRAVNGQPKGWFASPRDAANYLLYRAYEAAWQLQQVTNARRIAVVVIDGLSWNDFDVQLLEGWTDWLTPSFHDSDSWQAFAVTQGPRYPRSLKELAAVLQSVDAVWVLKWDDRHVLSRKFVREFDPA